MTPFRLLSTLILMLTISGVAHLQGMEIDVTYFVSLTGSDSNDGLTQETAFRTVTQAWNTIPQGVALTDSYIINILPGLYTAEDLPNYWESRYGTEGNIIAINALEGLNTVYLPAINMYDSRYIVFNNLNIELTEGGPFHCEKCDFIILYGNVFRGANPDTYATQETIKFNQSQHILLIENDISGAWDNAIDFVGVQYASIRNNVIYNAGDWCAYAKGGSAYITVEGNEIYSCGTGGFTAGQGTGFQFMTAPWTQYEAYAIWLKGNIIHDVQGAAVGIQGGYDVVVTDNIFYKVGERSHTIEVAYGLRTCDGKAGDESRARCLEYRDAGGWGNDIVDDGTLAVRIPNKNVVIYNNILYNPTPYQSADQHFSIFAPYEGPSQENSNLGRVVADENLQILGNLIWNGEATRPLGIEAGDFTAGCQDDNPTCNVARLLADNSINEVEPLFVDIETNGFTEMSNTEEVTASIPVFVGPSLPPWDVPVPAPDQAWFAYPMKQ